MRQDLIAIGSFFCVVDTICISVELNLKPRDKNPSECQAAPGSVCQEKNIEMQDLHIKSASHIIPPLIYPDIQ